jgi:hypothetical protein
MMQAKETLIAAIQIARAKRDGDPNQAVESTKGYSQKSIKELAAIWRKEPGDFDPTKMIEQQLDHIEQLVKRARARLPIEDAQGMLDDVGMFRHMVDKLRVIMTLWISALPPEEH